VGILGIAFFIYGLSLGPAYLALRKNHLRQSTFNSFYGPLVRPAMRYNISCEIVNWYCCLWYDDAKEIMRDVGAQLETNGFTVEPK
jgi:hypothetical protein